MSKNINEKCQDHKNMKLYRVKISEPCGETNYLTNHHYKYFSHKNIAIRHGIAHIILAKIIESNPENIYDALLEITGSLIGTSIRIDKYDIKPSIDISDIQNEKLPIVQAFRKVTITTKQIKSISLHKFALDNLIKHYKNYLEYIKENNSVDAKKVLYDIEYSPYPLSVNIENPIRSLRNCISYLEVKTD